VLSFLTHLPHGTFRSHLCLSLRETVSYADVNFNIDDDLPSTLCTHAARTGRSAP
jgi:hypothetical protein